MGKIDAAVRTPLAALEQLTRPVMHWFVPAQKAAVFQEFMGDWISQHPDASHDEMRTAARQYQNRVDARMGQVIYDRIFMNRTSQNVLQMLVRAPGWTGGTIVELGGAVPDTFKWAKQAVTGKGFGISDRMAYTAALLTYNAVINGTWSYINTGQMPTGADFWAHRTGRKNQDGSDERRTLPSYLKDVFSFGKHPLDTLVNKVNPTLSYLGDVYRNKDFYGDQVRDTSADFVTQLEQEALFAGKQFEPFSSQNLRRNIAKSSDVAGIVEPIIGINPAPKSMTQTTAESMISEFRANKRPSGGYSKDEQAKYEAKRAIRKEFLEDAIKSPNVEGGKKGVHFTPSEINEMKTLKAGGAAAAKLAVKHDLTGLSVDETMKVWNVMTPEEQDAHKKVVLSRVNKATSLSEAKKKEFRTEVRGF
jgi:hypothetical protein